MPTTVAAQNEKRFAHEFEIRREKIDAVDEINSWIEELLE
jgi:hypothetical protein